MNRWPEFEHHRDSVLEALDDKPRLVPEIQVRMLRSGANHADLTTILCVVRLLVAEGAADRVAPGGYVKK